VSVIVILGILAVVVAAVFGAPLFAVLSGIATLLFVSIGYGPVDVASELVKLVRMDTLTTIPLFTFAGYMLAESGAARRLVNVSECFLGWLPGGIAIIALLTCAFFTTFTGASGVTIVALGGLLLPVLRDRGYSEDVALGLLTTGGSRGLLFPPSLPVIIYGYVASVDIKQLFIAGMVPALIDLGVVALLIIVFFRPKRGNNTGEIANPWTWSSKKALYALRQALPELLIAPILIFLILTGRITVTEGASLAAAYVFVIEIWWYKDLSLRRDLPRVATEAMALCGAIIVILGASLGLTSYLVDQEIPQSVVTVMSTHVSSRIAIVVLINLFLLVVGSIMDIFSAIVVVVPLLVPLAEQFGIHPLHLAVIFLINLELGYNTPPVGMNLFISSFRFNIPLARIYRAVVPFVIANLVSLMIITGIPSITLFRVSTRKKNRSSIEKIDDSGKDEGSNKICALGNSSSERASDCDDEEIDF